MTACPLGFNTIGQLEDDVRTAQNFKPLTDEERKTLGSARRRRKFDVINGPALEYWKTR